MRKIKLKNVDVSIRHKLVITILFSAFCVLSMSRFLIRSISTNLIEYTSAKVKKENTLLLKEAFAQVEYKNLEIDDLINVIKNSKDEILEVDFHIDECARVLSEVTKYINESVNDYNYIGYRVDIPVGFASKTPLLINLGPKIPIKVEISDVALGNVRTVAKSFGINNALVEVYIDIYIKTSIIYPSQIIEVNTEYSSLVSSKIISGAVPNFYNGTFNSKSDAFNLPLNE